MSALERPWEHAIFVFVVGLAVAGLIVLSPGHVTEALRGATGLKLLVVLGIAYVVRPFVLLPMSILTVFVGYRYGIIGGVTAGHVGTLLTCIPPFVIGRRLGDHEGLMSKLAWTGRETFDAVGDLRGITAARLSPAPGDVVSYGAGLSNVRFRAYLAGTFLGELPWTGLYVLAGVSMESFTRTGLRIDPEIVTVLAAAAILLVAQPGIEWLRQRRYL